MGSGCLTICASADTRQRPLHRTGRAACRAAAASRTLVSMCIPHSYAAGQVLPRQSLAPFPAPPPQAGYVSRVGCAQNELFLQRDRIQALHAADLARVAKAHLHPAQQARPGRSSCQGKAGPCPGQRCACGQLCGWASSALRAPRSPCLCLGLQRTHSQRRQAQNGDLFIWP